MDKIAKRIFFNNITHFAPNLPKKWVMLLKLFC